MFYWSKLAGRKWPMPRNFYRTMSEYSDPSEISTETDKQLWNLTTQKLTFLLSNFPIFRYWPQYMMWTKIAWKWLQHNQKLYFSHLYAIFDQYFILLDSIQCFSKIDFLQALRSKSSKIRFFHFCSESRICGQIDQEKVSEYF